MVSTNLKLWGISLVSIISFTSCAFSTGHVSLSYVADPTKKSPLFTIKPITIVLVVDDQRPAIATDRVGEKITGFGTVGAKVIANTDVSLSLYTALKSEFENNGHRVLQIQDDRSEIVIDVHLKKFWSESKSRNTYIEMTGFLNVDIAIANPRTFGMRYSKAINTTFQERTHESSTDRNYESVLNGVLTEFIRVFARDQMILEALRRARQEKETR